MNHRELYRDPVNGKVSGVCAGFANFFGLEVWLVRILVITVALLGGFALVLIAYIALSLMLEKQPPQYSDALRSMRSHTLKDKAWIQGENAQRILATLEMDLKQLEQKVRVMEAYVTSETFTVHRRFRQL